ncbi:MAG: hypothetical protein PHV68_06375 [Candidatus Gastranaerophilales bacterium]|nr:hypothetical protein [Candidatus Gastranaerophilales bacterium]
MKIMFQPIQKSPAFKGQNNTQNTNMPKLQNLNQDKVSFGANEKTFLNKLNIFLEKKDGKTTCDEEEVLEAMIQDIDINHQLIKNFINEFESKYKDKNTFQIRVVRDEYLPILKGEKTYWDD